MMQNRRYLNKCDEVGVTGCRELPACNGQDEVRCDGGSCVYQITTILQLERQK